MCKVAGAMWYKKGAALSATENPGSAPATSANGAGPPGSLTGGAMITSTCGSIAQLPAQKFHRNADLLLPWTPWGDNS
jgi:hypothetical protein